MALYPTSMIMGQTMAGNTGKNSEKLFEENLVGLVFRLRDKADLVGLNKGKNVAAFGNPSDYFIVTKTGGYLAEVKSSLNKTSFSLSGFTPAQKAAITRCHKAGFGDRYLIYIHSLHLDQWFLITATDYYNAIILEKRKSIKWNLLNSLTSW